MHHARGDLANRIGDALLLEFCAVHLQRYDRIKEHSSIPTGKIMPQCDARVALCTTDSLIEASLHRLVDRRLQVEDLYLLRRATNWLLETTHREPVAPMDIKAHEPADKLHLLANVSAQKIGLHKPLTGVEDVHDTVETQTLQVAAHVVNAVELEEDPVDFAVTETARHPITFHESPDALENILQHLHRELKGCCERHSVNGRWRACRPILPRTLTIVIKTECHGKSSLIYREDR